MIKLTVGDNHKCEIPDEWNELTITQYSKVISFINEGTLPAITTPRTDEQEESWGKEQRLLNVKCNRRIFNYLTGLDMGIVNKINLDQMESMISIVTKLLSTKTEYVMKSNGERDSFKFKGKTYYFPYANMERTSFGDYIEAEQVAVANDKIQDNRFGAFAEQMAILCKEDGVENTEDIIKKKTRLFADLPMDIAWRFVFFLSKQTQKLKNSSQSYLKAVTGTQIDTLQKIGI